MMIVIFVAVLVGAEIQPQNFNFTLWWGGPLCGWRGGDGCVWMGRVEHAERREPHGLVRVASVRKNTEQNLSFTQ